MTAHWIATKRLTLEHNDPDVSGDDLYHMTRWLNDPEIVKYSEQRHKVHTQVAQLAYIASFTWPSQFRIIRIGKRMIGTITADVDSNNSIADIGILIGDKTEWGKGYGSEAWEALMHHLFGMGIRKIEAGCMAINDAMRKIFIKTNMEPEGIRKNHFIASHSNGGYIVCDLEQWARFRYGP